MTPKEFLDLYTYFKVKNPVTGFMADAPIRNYGSGWESNKTGNRDDKGELCNSEMHNGLFDALTVAVYGKEVRKKRLERSFQVVGLPNCSFPVAKFFYKDRINRVFLGKGSPDDIADVLQLAIAVGRIGTEKDLAGKRPAAPTVKAYVDAFITIDCNAFVGNYCGCDPSTSIGEYAVPTRKRSKFEEIKQGDIIISVNEAGRHCHIALVEAIVKGTDPKKPEEAMLTLCEWGEGGAEPIHYKTYKINLGHGPKKAYGLYYRYRNGTDRYFFAPPTDGATTAG